MTIRLTARALRTAIAEAVVIRHWWEEPAMIGMVQELAEKLGIIFDPAFQERHVKRDDGTYGSITIPVARHRSLSTEDVVLRPNIRMYAQQFIIDPMGFHRAWNAGSFDDDDDDDLFELVEVFMDAHGLLRHGWNPVKIMPDELRTLLDDPMFPPVLEPLVSRIGGNLDEGVRDDDPSDTFMREIVTAMRAFAKATGMHFSPDDYGNFHEVRTYTGAAVVGFVDGDGRLMLSLVLRPRDMIRVLNDDLAKELAGMWLECHGIAQGADLVRIDPETLMAMANDPMCPRFDMDAPIRGGFR